MKRTKRIILPPSPATAQRPAPPTRSPGAAPPPPLTPAGAAPTDSDLLRLPEVMERVRMRKTKIYELIRDGRFPEPVSLFGRGSAWWSHEIESWKRALPRKGAAL